VAAPSAACLTGTPRLGCLCPHVLDMLDSKLLGQMRMHDNLLLFCREDIFPAQSRVVLRPLLPHREYSLSLVVVAS